MSMSRTVSEINGDFSRKSQNSPVNLTARPSGFPLELDNGGWPQDGATRPRKKFVDVFSRLDTIHQCNGQTYGQRPTASTALTHSVMRQRLPTPRGLFH